MIRELHSVVAGSDADIPVFVTTPDAEGSFPTVIVYMDAFGPRDELYDICWHFSREGFAALLPNLYNRLGSPIFEPVNGRSEPLDPATINANDSTTIEMILADTRSLINAALSGAFDFVPAGFGVIGYCMGGRHALAATVGCPEVKAGISAHAGRLVDRTEHSPHLLVAKLINPFQFYHARDDETCPTEHRDMITREAENAGSHVISKTLDAYHGWSFPNRWAFDETASEFIWSRALELFRKEIVTGSGTS